MHAYFRSVALCPPSLLPNKHLLWLLNIQPWRLWLLVATRALVSKWRNSFWPCPVAAVASTSWSSHVAIPNWELKQPKDWVVEAWHGNLSRTQVENVHLHWINPDVCNGSGTLSRCSELLRLYMKNHPGLGSREIVRWLRCMWNIVTHTHTDLSKLAFDVLWFWRCCHLCKIRSTRLNDLEVIASFVRCWFAICRVFDPLLTRLMNRVPITCNVALWWSMYYVPWEVRKGHPHKLHWEAN